MSVKKQNQQSVTILPPVGGWNTRNPLDNMPPLDAIELVNVIPYTNYIRTRKGYRTHQSGLGTNTLVKTLVSYVKTDGTTKLLAGANGNIYDVTPLGGTPASLWSGNSSDTWQTCQFQGKIFFVNGVDAPRDYDGTTVVTTAWTGPTSISDLIHVSGFKNRLYFVEKNTGSIWFSGLNADTGALEQVNLSSELSQGGGILFTTKLTFSTGTAEEHQFVIVGEEGDVLIYSGDYPGGSWILSRRMIIPKPMGIRSFVEINTDVIILTRAGIISLTEVLQSGNSYQTLSAKFDAGWQALTKSYNIFEGWSILWHKPAKALIVNHPISDTSFNQIYINLENYSEGEGYAASRFEGLNAFTWCMHENLPYFGENSKVCEFENGELDNSIESISYKIRPAFNHLGDRSITKRFTAILPIVTYTNSNTISFALDTDLEESLDSSNIELSFRITPWGSPYGSPYSDELSSLYEWIAVGTTGRSLSVKIHGNNNGAALTLQSAQVIYEQGGIL